MIEIIVEVRGEGSGARRLATQDEAHARAVLGAALRHFSAEIEAVTVRFMSTAKRGANWLVEIDVTTSAGSFAIQRIGATRSEALVRATEPLERRLFAVLHREGDEVEANDPFDRIAA